jgi:hypothetical protein
MAFLSLVTVAVEKQLSMILHSFAMTEALFCLQLQIKIMINVTFTHGRSGTVVLQAIST